MVDIRGEFVLPLSVCGKGVYVDWMSDLRNRSWGAYKCCARRGSLPSGIHLERYGVYGINWCMRSAFLGIAIKALFTCRVCGLYNDICIFDRLLGEFVLFADETHRIAAENVRAADKDIMVSLGVTKLSGALVHITFRYEINGVKQSSAHE